MLPSARPFLVWHDEQGKLPFCTEYNFRALAGTDIAAISNVIAAAKIAALNMLAGLARADFALNNKGLNFMVSSVGGCVEFSLIDVYFPACQFDHTAVINYT